MALATDPTYSTIEQFQVYTPVAAQIAIDEDSWKPFALRAERILDTYVNIPEENKYDIDQNLKFPIKDANLNSLLPDEITLAHIEITSDLILKGDATAEDGLYDGSESWDSSGYSVTKQKKSSSSSDDVKIQMPPLARRLLLPWTSRVAPLKY
jgi:hypothetical protein